jgi:ATP-dependent DNA helicase RecG
MKVMKYVNMFNRGVSRVQEYLKQNGSMPAQFNIDKLTVFEVVVTDATNEALERNSAELGRNSAKIAELIENDGNLLMLNVLDKQYSSAELLEIVNSARTQQKLGRRSSRTFISTTLKKVIELGLFKPLYPNTPHHPRQKYLVTESGMAYHKILISEKGRD